MNQIEKKVKRIIDLEAHIKLARERGNHQWLEQLCILMTLERIEDRLQMIIDSLKEQNLRKNKK